MGNLKNGKSQPQAPTVYEMEDREMVASGDTGPGCMGAVTQACGRKATGSGTNSPSALRERDPSEFLLSLGSHICK